MTVKERFSRPVARADRGSEERLRAEDRSRADAEEERSRVGAAEAESLIADLAALIDAGLVVVYPQVLGPARYGPRLNLDDAA